jgi:hypothetical protein
MARFQEVSPFSGVDESVTPTGIIVPWGPGNFNLVRLTGGLGIPVRPPLGSSITIDEMTGIDLLPIALQLGLSGVAAPSLRTLLGERLFMISGTLPVSNVRVRAGSDTLRIAVLKPRPVKLSIRPVQVRDPNNPNGALVYHSKQPFDVNAMVAQMNNVWTPQANVVFTLVSSTPVPLIDEPKLAKIMGLTEEERPAVLPEAVNMTQFKGLLIDNRDKNADLTMFLVERVAEGQVRNLTYTGGLTHLEPGFAISLISDSRTKEPLLKLLMAHEAGHFVGNMAHTDDAEDEKFRPLDKRKQLMVNGGASLGYQLIPFDLVIQRFNKQS